MIKSNIIHRNILKFRDSKNPYYLIRAIYLVVTQKRIYEVVHGFVTDVLSEPAPVELNCQDTRQVLQQFGEVISKCRRILSRENIIEAFGNEFMVRDLPADFTRARVETIVYGGVFLIIGEYGNVPKRRLFYVTISLCRVIDYYMVDPRVRHIHSIHMCRSTGDILVTTGDAAKYLDLWHLHNDELGFVKRLKCALAGYTDIIRVSDEYYLGTDFSGRPNYIETLSGEKFFFPAIAYRMFVVSFYQYENRYIASINSDVLFPGGRFSMSIFDTARKQFIYCNYLDYVEPTVADAALQREAVLLRSMFT